MRRSYRNDEFAGKRQEAAQKLIESLVDKGLKIAEISKQSRIATSTIAKWFHDSTPNPRTLARLEGLKSRIDAEEKHSEKVSELRKEAKEWYYAGGNDRVKEFQLWMREHGEETANDHPNFEVSFPYWKKEREHEWKGQELGLCGRKRSI